MAFGTVGVEEEYQLIDAATGALRPVNDVVVDEARSAVGNLVHPELQRSQVEVSTPVCRSLDEVERELRGLRRRLNATASRYGCRLGAAGSHPAARWESQEVTPSERYQAMVGKYQQMALETLIFGCHVHVGLEDVDLRIEVMNRIRRWLPTLLALSGNSPYWGGRDTGYASYRTMIFRRWPTTGMPRSFASDHDYQRTVETLVRAGAIEDATHLYWDVRPSARFPTLEIRIPDVCLTVDDAVTMTGLVAAMVETGRREAVASAAGGGSGSSGESGSSGGHDVGPELLDAAVWRAARYGVLERLIDVENATMRPAGEVVGRLLASLRPALDDTGTRERVEAGVARILAGGTGASRQRAVRERTGSLVAVAAFIADQTGDEGLR